DDQRRVQLTKEALVIWPDCADAYVLLAEHATSRKEARRLYEQGVAAGEWALGAEAFGRDVGHFWGILETRPYMRARLGLAHALWSAGRREQAVSFLAAWKSTAGAVAWLRASIGKAKKEPVPQPKGPLGFIKKWLNKNLPQGCKTSVRWRGRLQ